MPRFLGLFSRKPKHTDNASANGSDDHDSSVSGSPTTSGSLGWDKSISPSPSRSIFNPGAARSHGERSAVYPSSPSASSTASTSKIRLPFGRKRQQPTSPAPGSTTSINATETAAVQHRAFLSAPRPSLDMERGSFVSDGPLTESRRLRPPPSKSAIFAAYADPHSALSTRSLPNDASQPLSLQDSVQSFTPPENEPTSEASAAKSAPNTAKKSFFSWTKSSQPTQVAKSRSKSTPPSQPFQEPIPDPFLDVSISSFNLKSFRHVGPSSSLDIQVPPPTLDVPSPSHSPLPRPRGPSVGESSQRISVGAFREAQARRSMAGSPVPSPRSSGLFTAPPAPQEPGGANGRASPRLGPGRSSFLFDTKSDDHSSPQIKNRRALVSDSDADTSSVEEESDDDSDHERTVTQRGVWTGKMKAKSELGHTSRDDRSEGHGRPRSSLGYNNEPRPRASASTSAATPSAAAKRASIIANSNSKDPVAGHKRISQHIREASVWSNPGSSAPSAFPMKQLTRPTSPGSDSSSDDDDDDAPLATLVPPRRPGSALSSASGSSHPSIQNSSRSTSNLHKGKPLIDINEVIGNKAPSLPVREGKNEALSEDKGFTKGNTLLSTSSSPNASPPRSRVPAPITTSFRMSAAPLTTSPTESVNSSGFATAPSSAKPIPPPSFPLPPNNEQVAQKRDGLNERLAKVAKNVSATATSSSPLSTPPRPNQQNNADIVKRPFPKALVSPQPSFERPRSASPAPAISHLSTDMTSLPPPKVISLQQLKPSPPDEELAKMLGAGIKLISRTGESSPEAFDAHFKGSESEDSSDSSGDEDEPENDSREDKADDWENVDPKEAKFGEEYKIKDGLLKGKGVLGGRGKDKEKDTNAKELAPKVTEPPIAPIPIRQRQPTPSFSVMSRPPLVRNGVATSSSGAGSASGSGSRPGSGSTSVILSSTSSGSLASSSSNGNSNRRQRSTSLLNPSLPDSRLSQSSPNASPVMGSSDATRSRGAALAAPPIRSAAISRSSATSKSSAQEKSSTPGTNRSSVAMESPSSSVGRPRSSTILPAISVTPVPPVMPIPPFARRESPASSTGDSSNGRAPLTPRDGSDIGSTGGNHSAMKGASAKKYGKRRSVCFEDELKDDDDAPSSSPGKGKTMHKESKEKTEEKRKERRRSEAKAAIELGNVINGRAPIVDDDDDDDGNDIKPSMQARMSTFNPMMGMHPMQMGSVPSWNGPWSNPMGQQSMMNGQYVYPPAADPSLFAAHQQAMMIAKQAYQLAVAQQAAAAAGDEWERGSMVSGFSGLGRGPPSHMSAPYGMGMNMNMNMNMMGMGHNWPSGHSGIFPSSARSMFGGISASRSEYGGTTGGAWGSSRSTYGEAFGPPTGRIPKSGTTDRDRRDSGHFPPVPPIPPQAQANSRTMGSARPRTNSQPASRMKKSPPSSWKG